MNLDELRKLSPGAAMQAAAQELSLPNDFFDRMWAQESGRGQNKQSAKGAQGDFQIMPATQQAWESRDKRAYNANDFYDSLYMAARTMGENLAHFKDPIDATRAYNGGWKQSRWGNPETVGYVQALWGNQVAAQPGAKTNPIPKDASPEDWPRLPALPTVAQKPGMKQADDEAAMVGIGTMARQGAAEALTAGPAFDALQAQQAAAAKVTARRDATGVMDVGHEAERDPRVMPTWSVMNKFEAAPADPSYDYMAHREQLEIGMSDDERSYMRENATSEQAAMRARAEIDYRRGLDQTYADAGPWKTFAGQMAAGLTDPASLVMGLGTVKAFQMGRIGSGALAAAGRPGAAVASMLAENATVNLGIEALSDAVGETKSSADYAMAAASGMVLAAPFTRGVYRSANEAAIQNAARSIHERGVQEQAASAATVLRDEPGLPPEQVARRVEDNEAEQINQAVKESTGPTRQDAVIPDEIRRSMEDEFTGTPMEQPAPLKAAKETQDLAPDVPVEEEHPVLQQIRDEGTVTRQVKDTSGESIRLSWDAEGNKLPGHGNLGEVLDAIKDHPLASPIDKRLATYLSKVMSEDGLGIDIRFSARDARSRFDPNGPQVSIHGGGGDTGASAAAGNDLAAHVAGLTKYGVYSVLHEIVHAATYHRLNAWETAAGKLRPEQARVLAQFQDLFDRFKAEVDEHLGQVGSPNMGARYSASNIHEFAAQMFTDRQTRFVLSVMPGKPVAGRSSSALREFIGLVKRVLGIDDNKNAFTEGSKLLDQLIALPIDNITHHNGEPVFAAERALPRDLEKFIDNDANVNPEDRAYKIGTVEAMKEAQKLVGVRTFRDLAEARATPQGKWEAGPAASIEMVARNIVNYFDKNKPSPLEAAANPKGTFNALASRKSRDKWAEKMTQYASDYMTAHPIDLERLKVLTAKIGGVSDGLRLAASKNPIMQLVASLVTETTTGAAGRQANVAIRSKMLHAKLIGNAMLDYDNAYTVFRDRNRGGVLEDVWAGNVRRKFDQKVYEEVISRRLADHTPSADGSVVEAADTLEKLFDRSRQAQIDAGVLGFGNLPTNSKGYMPQALDGVKLQAATPKDMALLHEALAKQFEDRLGWDRKFAADFAPFYTERARRRAMGDKNIEGLGAGGDGLQLVRDTLEDMQLDPSIVDRARAGESKQGQGHTKKRIDVDMLQELRPGLRMMDFYVTNPLVLARSYAKRTAGTVALTEAGIHGIRGLRELRQASMFKQDAQPTKHELDAFDRVQSEILGSPVTGRVVSAGATNMQLLVTLQKLGGLVFTQSAETFNMLHHLGLRSLLSGVSDLPRILGEVGRLKRGEASGNHILTSIEAYGGEIGTESYKMVAPLDAPDHLLSQYVDQPGLLSRLLRAGGHLQSKVSGFRGFLAGQHRMVAEQIVMKAVRYIRDGKNDIALRDMGFTDEVAKSLRNDLKEVAHWDERDNLESFDLTKVKDARTAEAFVQAVHRGASQIIQGHFIGERNAWFHNDYMKLLLQLRTFGLTASEKQWGRTRMNHGYTYAAGMLLGQMALALPIHAARVQITAMGLSTNERDKFIKDNINPAQLVKATMNYASISGNAGDVLEILSGLAGGWGDSRFKETVGAKQQAMSVGKIVPVLGTLDAASRVASGRADLHTAVKQLPFSNLWYLAPALNLTKKD
jgi:hypothetical protein